jgi:hypothetical protein
MEAYLENNHHQNSKEYPRSSKARHEIQAIRRIVIYLVLELISTTPHTNKPGSD